MPEAPRTAAFHGLRAGVLAVGVALAVGVVVRVAGGPGRAVAGDALLATAGLLLLAAVVLPGVHLTRWAEREVLAERAQAAHRIDPRRAFVLTAAAVCVVGLAATLLVPS